MTAAEAAVQTALRHATARLADLFQPGQRLVVAYSGGQDSSCLLHALRQHRGLDLVAAHVDHGLRPDSAASGARAVDLAEAIGVHPEVRRVDVAAYRAGLPRWSVQQAARAARYQVLAAVVQEVGGAALLVAHTADDQAETVLMNLLRGTGLAGLAGMRLDEVINPRRLGPPVPDLSGLPERLRVARPLLTVERSTTQAYCDAVGLTVVEDTSNAARAYTRNRVRLDLLPLLEQFNPAVRSLLVRTADLVAEDNAFLESLVDADYTRLAREHLPEEIEVSLEPWRGLHRAMQRRLLRHALAHLLDTEPLVDVPAGPIEDALDLVQSSRAPRAYHLPYGIELCIGTDAFVLRLHGRARRRTRANTWGSSDPRV
jgi:tRNA(Ile)-lysidine synthase